MLPVSSLNRARVWQRAMTSLAQSLLSRLACTRFTLTGDCELSARIGLANAFCRRPAGQDESGQDLPAIPVSVGCYRKMIADHEKDYGHCHEGVVLGAQLGLSAECRIKLRAGSSGGDHLALSGENPKTNIGRHNGPEHRPHVDKSSAPTENIHQAP